MKTMQVEASGGSTGPLLTVYLYTYRSHPWNREAESHG